MFKFSSESTSLSQNLSKAWQHNIELSLRDKLISVVTFKALPFKLVQYIFENSLQREQYENNTKMMCRCNTIVEIQ